MIQYLQNLFTIFYDIYAYNINYHFHIKLTKYSGIGKEIIKRNINI